MTALGVYFQVLFRILFSFLGLPVLGLTVAIVLVSRTGLGKRRVGSLCVAGYLLSLAYLYWIGASWGSGSIGLSWLPLLAMTLPWSYLFDPISGQGLHVEGSTGMILNFALLVGLYGGLNSLFVFGVVRLLKRRTSLHKTS